MQKLSLIVLLFFSLTTLKGQQMPECWYRSKAAFDMGEYKTALLWIDSCVAIKPRINVYWSWRGELLFKLGNCHEAIESSTKAEKLKQGSSAYTLAKTYSMVGDSAASYFWLKIYLGQSEKVTEGAIKLDPVFSSYSKSKQWKDLWKKDWYSSYEKLVNDAMYSIANDQWEEALDLLNPRLKGGKPRPQLLALRGKAYYGLKNFKHAADDYSLAIKRSKNGHEYLEGRAMAYIALERFGAAIVDLTRAISISGGNPQYFKIRAEAYHKSKQYNLALDDIRYYITFYPSDTEANFLLAIIAVDAGYYVDALFSLGKLIKSNPNEAKYFYYRGISYLRTNSYAEAEADLNFAISKEYNLADTYYHRAVVLLNLGKKEDACVDIEKAAKKGNFAAQELQYKHCKKPLQQQKW